MLALHSYQCRYQHQHQHQHSGFPNITRERSTSTSYNSRLLRFDVFHTIGYLNTVNRVFLVKLKIGEASGIPSYSPLVQKVATINKKSSLTVITASVNLKKSNQMPCTVVTNSIKLCLLATWGVPFLQFSHSEIRVFAFFLEPCSSLSGSARACCHCAW
jgi:hypothetical protein